MILFGKLSATLFITSEIEKKEKLREEKWIEEFFIIFFSSSVTFGVNYLYCTLATFLEYVYKLGSTSFILQEKMKNGRAGIKYFHCFSFTNVTC